MEQLQHYLPLFTRCKRQDNVTECYICLHRNEKDNHKRITCGHICRDFGDFVTHLVQHGLALQYNVDYCNACEVVFASKPECLEHWLGHAINSSISPTVLEGNQSEEEGVDIWLNGIFEKLGEVRKEILEHIFCHNYDLENCEAQVREDGSSKVEGIYREPNSAQEHLVQEDPESRQ